eukprot:9485565-Pyramimonas_sp.AAC.1
MVIRFSRALPIVKNMGITKGLGAALLGDDVIDAMVRALFVSKGAPVPFAAKSMGGSELVGEEEGV